MASRTMVWASACTKTGGYASPRMVMVRMMAGSSGERCYTRAWSERESGQSGLVAASMAVR